MAALPATRARVRLSFVFYVGHGWAALTVCVCARARNRAYRLVRERVCARMHVISCAVFLQECKTCNVAGHGTHLPSGNPFCPKDTERDTETVLMHGTLTKTRRATCQARDEARAHADSARSFLEVPNIPCGRLSGSRAEHRASEWSQRLPTSARDLVGECGVQPSQGRRAWLRLSLIIS